MLPDETNALQMRSVAYSHPSDPTLSADDLRKALRDQRRVVELVKEASPADAADFEKPAQEIESLLRKRIAADLGALRLEPK